MADILVRFWVFVQTWHAPGTTQLVEEDLGVLEVAVVAHAREDQRLSLRN